MAAARFRGRCQRRPLKSLHPSALTTLVREAVNGHIVHAPAGLRSDAAAPVAVPTRPLVA